jgi:4-hydroxybenzoate polyprenyltransferase
MPGDDGSRGNSLYALIGLFHPVPVLLTLLGAGLFALVAAGGRIQAAMLFLILATLLFSQIAIAVFNDICDRKLDAVARPGRAFPRRLIRPTTAMWIVTASALVSLVLSSRLGLESLFMVAIGTGFGLAYSLAFKRSIWSWMPFAVAFPLLPVWIIHTVDPRVSDPWTVFAIGIPVAVAIHIADSIPDVEADRRAASSGIAVRLGTGKSFIVCRVLLVIGAAIGLFLSPLTPSPLVAVAGSTACLGGVLMSAWNKFRPPAARHVIAGAAILLGAGWVGALCL